ncbi:hypothetical protein JW865_02280 [Candidatus Bathyarchaeota archaeon]|nr:hypothetical protein [Candidatus Bathyarchaeota archaeon]
MEYKVKEDKKNLIFVSVINPDRNSRKNSLLLAESIRAFAGTFSNNPIWFLFQNTQNSISKEFKKKLDDLSIDCLFFEPIDSKIFLINEIKAGVYAESIAKNFSSLIVWMSTNSIIIQEPKEFLLKNGKNLGYRPVHHILIGSKFEDPIDNFWLDVFDFCKVEEDKIFAMRSHVDGLIIRSYFNAGLLVFRPENKLFEKWYEKLISSFYLPKFQKYFKKDRRYSIFMHQAILTGVILSNYSRDELFEFSSNYNYPIHLIDEDVTKIKPHSMDELITLRHEGLEDYTNWSKHLFIRKNFNEWLHKHIIF